eukprot:scaffold3964_cov77-Skeletonema_marinoi.AAC.27
MMPGCNLAIFTFMHVAPALCPACPYHVRVRVSAHKFTSITIVAKVFAATLLTFQSAPTAIIIDCEYRMSLCLLVSTAR